MDGMQSWSSFEQQQRNNNIASDPSSAAAPTSISKGISALYVSSSSPDIAPAAASLLRHSGLTAPNNSKGSGKTDGGFESQRKDDEEFRLRFHWMRPHPSLAFALEEELVGGEEIKAEKEEIEQQHTQNKKRPKKQINLAVESSRLMEAYRSSQMKKQLDVTTNGEGNDGGDPGEDNSKSCNKTEADPTSGNAPTDNMNTITHNLPFELPKLRINLASLVEPPLMSSWLPGEDTDISYDSDDEGDDMDE